MSAIEERMINLEKKLDYFKDEVHRNDLATVTALTRIETLLNGLLTKKGAVGYGASSGGLVYLIFKLIFEG